MGEVIRRAKGTNEENSLRNIGLRRKMDMAKYFEGIFYLLQKWILYLHGH